MAVGCDISSKIALRLTSLDLSDDKSSLVQVMAWCRQAPSHYLNQCWPRYLPPYGVTRPQWVNSPWSGEAIWRHRSGSTLAQVMACCLMVPSHNHCLKKCWLFIGEVLWYLPESNFTMSWQVEILYDQIEIYTFNITVISPWDQSMS